MTDIGAIIREAMESLRKSARRVNKEITMWLLAKRKCFESNNERRRKGKTLIREKAYIRAYRNKCRRHNVREIHTLDREVQKEEV